MKISFILFLLFSLAHSDDLTKLRSEIKQLNKTIVNKDKTIKKYKKALKTKEKEIIYLKKKLQNSENIFPKLMLKEKYE
nr:hypothetical protein [uncultured Sulfurimonas sp.]